MTLSRRALLATAGRFAPLAAASATLGRFVAPARLIAQDVAADDSVYTLAPGESWYPTLNNTRFEVSAVSDVGRAIVSRTLPATYRAVRYINPKTGERVLSTLTGVTMRGY